MISRSVDPTPLDIVLRRKDFDLQERFAYRRFTCAALREALVGHSNFRTAAV